MNEGLMGIIYFWIAIGGIWLFFQESIIQFQKLLAVFMVIFNFGMFWLICIQPQLRNTTSVSDYN